MEEISSHILHWGRLKLIGWHWLAWPALEHRCKDIQWSFPSHKTHRVVLIFVSLALSHTPVYTARPMGLVQG